MMIEMQTTPRDKFAEITSILEDEGYKPVSTFETKFRYTFIKDPEPTLVLGVKIPITIPILHQPPIELVSFYCSLVIRPRWLDENFEVMVRFLAVSFKQIFEEMKPYIHDFNLEKYKPKLNELIEKYYPKQESTDNNSLIIEEKLYSAIRDKLFEYSESFRSNCLKISQDVLDIYRDFHLKPTDELPPELSEGFPIHRHNFVVMFKNEEPSEFLIEEPGCVSYLRDYQYHNVWIRTALDTNTPNLFYEAFEDQDYRFNYLFYDWIIYCRGLIKPLIALLDSPQFQFADLKSFSEIQFLKEHICKRIVPGLYLPRLCYENLFVPEKKIRTNLLFENPPSSLEELTAIFDFNQANLNIMKGNYGNAQQFLLDARRKLRKFHHTKGQVKVLFKLYELEKRGQNFSQAINYLKESLELAQTGKIPVSDIIQIHIYLSYAYAMNNNEQESIQHYNIPLKFLNSIPSEPDVDGMIMQIYLERAKLFMEKQKYEDANKNFKEILKNIKKDPKYEFLYYYWRSFYYAATNKPTKQLLALQKVIELKEGPHDERIQAYIELGKLYLYSKNEPEKSLSFLVKADKMIQPLNIESLRLKIKCNEMLVDAFRGVKNENAAIRAIGEAETLRERLDRLH